MEDMQGLVLFWNIISKCGVVDKKLSARTGLTAAKDLQIRRSFCTLVLIFGMLHFDNPGDLQRKRISDKDVYLSNIPSSPAYGVFISQLIRYARACSSYECFILRASRLSSKLLKQGYLVERLKSSFRKFYGRYGDLIQQYEVSISRMLNDILTLDQQWLPNQSDFLPISWPWYWLWPSPNYEWFPWCICNGCDMPAGNAYPSGHLVPSPILGLANAPIVETRFLELAMYLLDFSPRIPLDTFSILLSRQTCMSNIVR